MRVTEQVYYETFEGFFVGVQKLFPMPDEVQARVTLAPQ